MPYWTKLEKLTLTGLAGLALMMFFFPLLAIQAPLVGEQNVSGYDIFSRVRQFSRQVDKSSAQLEKAKPAQQQTPAEEKPPMSLRLAWMVPIEVTVSFMLAIVVFIGAMGKVKVSSLGALWSAVASMLAVLHIMIANSDLHAWLAASFKISAGELKGNPFAGIAEQFGNMMLNAFKLRPGGGLYILVICMVLAALVAKSRILSNFKLVAAEQSASAGN